MVSFFKTIASTLLFYINYLKIFFLSRLGSSLPPKSKSMLILAHSFPPKITGGTWRPASLANYASKTGWQVNVIRGKYLDPVTDAGLLALASLCSSISIHDSIPDHRTYSHRLSFRIDGGFQNIFSTFKSSLNAYTTSSPDTIFATGPPFYNFVAGFYLSRFYGAKLIIDFRDEWTLSPFDFVVPGNSDDRWEAKCAENADALIFTTQSQLDKFLEKYPLIPIDKCHIVENGWEERDFENVDNLQKKSIYKTSSRTIAYVGVLGDHAAPREFLSLLEIVLGRNEELRSTLQVIFVGNKFGAAKELLRGFKYPGNIQIIEHIPKLEAISLMKSVDALILFATPNMERYIPGKLYDYIASHTPVIALGHPGEISTIIESLGVGILIEPTDDYSLEQYLLGKMSIDNNPKITAWLREHTRAKMAERILEIAKSC